MSDKTMLNSGGCVKLVAQTLLETEYGSFDFLVYLEESTGKEHIVLKKDWDGDAPYVRLHSECATGDIFRSVHCDCGPQLDLALQKIQDSGGLVLYLKQEGRGIGLTEKIKAYNLQHEGKDTVEANLELGYEVDERAYELAVDILRDLKVNKLKLMTNNPEKVKSLRKYDFEVEQVPHQVEVTSEKAKKYLEVKKEKMGHSITDFGEKRG